MCGWITVRSSAIDKVNTTKPAGVIDALPAAALVLTTGGVVVQVNPAWSESATSGLGSATPVQHGDDMAAKLQDVGPPSTESAASLIDGLRGIGTGQRNAHAQPYICQAGPANGLHRLWVEVRPFVDQTQSPRLLLTQRDVTAEYQVDRALLESESRYHAVVEDQVDMICRFLPDTTLTFVNGPYCRNFDKTREQLLGMKFIELVPEKDRPEILKNLQDFTVDRHIASYEHQVTRPDGTLGWQAWTDRALFDEAGRIREFQSVGRDITERKRADQELVRQREESQTILDALPAFVFYKDTKNNILRVNRAVCEAAGLPADQIEGRNTAEVYPEQAEAYYKDDLAVIRSGKPKLGYIEKLASPGGKDRWVRTDKVPLFDRHREPAGVIVIALDVTELKQTSEKLEISEQRFRGLFDRVPVGIIEQDMTGIERWFESLRAQGVDDLADYLGRHPELLAESLQKAPIQNVNQAACDLMSAATRDELIEARRRGRLGTEPEATLFKLMMVWDRRRSGEIETRYRNLAGRKIDVLLRVVIPEADGRPDLTRVLLAMTDISANRQRLFAQAQVSQAERERRMLAHELHDTLAQQITGMNMLAEGLRRRLEAQGVAEAPRAAELTAMLGQANTDVRRLISGLSAPRITPDELETALDSLAGRIALVHHLPVSFHCGRGPDPDDLDEDSVNHLLYIAQEATHNAAKHASASSIQITLDQADAGLTLSVADDGIGLPVDPPTSNPVEAGAGLGLGIMRYRAEVIGATIRFDSTPESGTVVRCFLPTHPPPITLAPQEVPR